MKVNIGKYREIGRKVDVALIGSDVWSFDHTLAYIILPGLLMIKESKLGIPGEFAQVGGEDWVDQLSFDFYKDTADEMFEVACKRWEEVLDKMIWSFQQIVEDEYHDKYYYGKPEYGFEENDEQMVNPLTNKKEKLYTMVDKNPDEHWFDIAGLTEHQNRIQEGLELFGKHYRSLWN